MEADFQALGSNQNGEGQQKIMNFAQNLKAFLKRLPLRKMSGHQKFLAIAAVQCRGKTHLDVSAGDIRKQWRKSVSGVSYNPSFYDRAQQEGWVNPVSKGKFLVTEAGIENILALSPEGDLATGELKQSGSLIIVNKKGTHTFDKFLRKVFAEAKNQVLIADSWVGGTIFDNVLDVIPKTIPIKLIYAHPTDNFEQRAKRFFTEYQKFSARKYKSLHDRFMIVDDTGYVLGPWIKDAAMNSPALVVILSSKSKRLLQSFFDALWTKGR